MGTPVARILQAPFFTSHLSMLSRLLGGAGAFACHLGNDTNINLNYVMSGFGADAAKHE
jgi:hypothetical protein